MLQVTKQVGNLVPPTLNPNLPPLVGPAQNLVNGYNIAEQTCFHRTTVSHLIATLRRIVASYTAALPVLNDLSALLQSGRTLIADSTALIRSLIGPPPGTTLLGAVTALLTTIIGMVTTIVGSITTLIASIGTLLTATRIAAIVVAASAVSCALFWVPGIGAGLFTGGTIAAIAALAVLLFIVLTTLGTVMALLGTINTALGTLTAPLGTVRTAVTPVVNSLTTVGGTLSLIDAQIGTLVASTGSLNTCTTVLQNSIGQLDSHTLSLQTFLVRPSNQPYVPRRHLSDTYEQAVRVYQDALSDLQAAAGVWNAMSTDQLNAVQLNPTQVNPPAIDDKLHCGSVPSGDMIMQDTQDLAPEPEMMG